MSKWTPPAQREIPETAGIVAVMEAMGFSDITVRPIGHIYVEVFACCPGFESERTDQGVLL